MSEGAVAEGLADLLAAAGADAVRVTVGRARAGRGVPTGHPTQVVSEHALDVSAWGPVGYDLVVAARDLVGQMGLLRDERDELTEALVEAHDRLVGLYDLAAVQVHTLDPAAAVQEVLEEALRLTDAVAAALTEPGRPAATAGDATLAGWLETQVGEPDRPVTVTDPRGRTAVLVPLGDPAGATLALGRTWGDSFRTGEQKLAEAVGAVLSGVVSLTRRHEQDLAAAAIEREHEITSRLAQAVLPDAAPQVDGAELFARCLPARRAGGDFYSFEVVGEHLMLVTGDVAGKGLPAALVMTKVIAASHSAFLQGDPEDPAGMVLDVNRQLHGYLAAAGLFATLLVAAYDPVTGRLTVCNAGHSPVLHVSDRGCVAVPPSTVPIGVIRERRGTNTVLRLSAGDSLVVGSDGLAEQEDPSGRMFGYRAVHDLVQEAHVRGTAAAALGTALLDAVTEHAAGAPAGDDRTLVVLQRSRPPR